MPSDSKTSIRYSGTYQDDSYEYRHVTLPRNMVGTFPNRLLTEDEWRAMGVRQSNGWVHYLLHEPEPHILLFRRSIQKIEESPKEEDAKEKD